MTAIEECVPGGSFGDGTSYPPTGVVSGNVCIWDPAAMADFCAGFPESPFCAVEVATGPPPVPVQGLPATGSGTTLLLLFAVFAVCLGVVLSTLFPSPDRLTLRERFRAWQDR